MWNTTIILSGIIGLVIVYVIAVTIYTIIKKQPICAKSLNPVKLPFFKKKDDEEVASGKTAETDGKTTAGDKPVIAAKPASTTSTDAAKATTTGTTTATTQQLNDNSKSFRFSEPLIVDGNVFSDDEDDEQPILKLKLNTDEKFKNIKIEKEYATSDGKIQLKFDQPMDKFTLRLYGHMKNLKIIGYNASGSESIHIERFDNSRWINVNEHVQYDKLLTSEEKNIISLSLRNNRVKFNTRLLEETVPEPIQYFVLVSSGKIKLRFDHMRVATVEDITSNEINDADADEEEEEVYETE